MSLLQSRRTNASSRERKDAIVRLILFARVDSLSDHQAVMTANSLRRCSKLDLSNELLAAAFANETSKINPVPRQGGREHKRGSEASTPSHVFRGGLSAWNFSEVSVSTGGALTRHPGTPRLRCNDPCKRRNASWRASYAVIGERATPVPGEGGGGGGARAFIRRTTNPAAPNIYTCTFIATRERDMDIMY